MTNLQNTVDGVTQFMQTYGRAMAKNPKTTNTVLRFLFDNNTIDWDTTIYGYQYTIESHFEKYLNKHFIGMEIKVALDEMIKMGFTPECGNEGWHLNGRPLMNMIYCTEVDEETGMEVIRYIHATLDVL